MTSRMHRTLPMFAFLLFGPLASWAASPQPDTTSAPENADQAAHWKTVQTGSRLAIRIDPHVDLGRYRDIKVGHVSYTGQVVLSPAESGEMTSLLRDALARDISALKLDTRGTAGGTLTLDADITRVRKSHPWVNVLTTAAVFVPLDLGEATVKARLVDSESGRIVAEFETVGCGQVYQVWQSLQPLGQSKLLLKKNSRRIAQGIAKISEPKGESNVTIASR